MAVKLSRAALKDLRAIPQADADRLLDALEAVRPGKPQPNVVPLKGVKGAYRLRKGKWRAIFMWNGGDMLVARIKSRKDAYR